MSLDTVGRRPRDATPLYRLAHYQITYQPDKRQLKTVTEPRLFEAPHRSPQLPLWEVGEGEWLQVLRLPDYAPRRRRPASHASRRCSRGKVPPELGQIASATGTPEAHRAALSAPALRLSRTQAGTPSTRLSPDASGTTRARRNPACSKSARCSPSVRWRLPSTASMLISSMIVS